MPREGVAALELTLVAVLIGIAGFGIWRDWQEMKKEEPKAIEENIAATIDALTPMEKEILLYTALCGGVCARSDDAARFFEQFFNEYYRDGKLARRPPYVIATFNSLEEFQRQLLGVANLIKQRWRSTAKYRLAVRKHNGVFGIAFLVSNAAVEQTEFDDEVLQQIHQDLAKRLAFIDEDNGGEVDAVKEIMLLGVIDFAPWFYACSLVPYEENEVLEKQQ